MARGKGDGSIFYRADKGKWVSSVTLPDGTRRTFYGNERKDVVAKLHDAQEAIKNALPIPSARLTLGAYLTSYLEDVAPKRLTPTTLKHYKGDARLYILPALGKLKLAEVTPQRVQAMLNGLAERGLGPDTEQHCRAVLRVVLAQAQREGLIAQNAAKLVVTTKGERKRVRPLTPADARAIVAAFAEDPLGPLVTLSLATGLRQAEALGLGWDDVDLDARTLTVRRQLQRIDGAYQLVRPKTERSRRTLVLPAAAIDALRKQRARQAEQRLRAGDRWHDSGRIFTSDSGGYVNGSWVTHAFQKRLAAAGLPALTWHHLRHGAASLLLAQGASMRVVMEQLGHSQISLTMNTYAHIAPELLHDAAARLDQALGG